MNIQAISPLRNFQTNYKSIKRNVTNYNFQPVCDTVSFKAREARLTPETKEKFDTKIYNFKMEDGSNFKGTIREFLEKSIVSYSSLRDGEEIYHNLYTKDDGLRILKNGLDWSKAGRIQAGPGTYFSPSASCGEMYGLSYYAITAQYKGGNKEFPIMEFQFYDRLKEAVPDMPAKYYHDLMVDEMGIDFIGAPIGTTRPTGFAYVVLNDKCMRLGKNW